MISRELVAKISCVVLVVCVICLLFLGRKVGYWHEPIVV